MSTTPVAVKPLPTTPGTVIQIDTCEWSMMRVWPGQWLSSAGHVKTDEQVFDTLEALNVGWRALDADPYDAGTCAACGELPFGHDNFGCTGRGHASKVNDCGTCDEWDTNCPHEAAGMQR